MSDSDMRVGLSVLRLSGEEDNYHADWLEYYVSKLKEGYFVVSDSGSRPGVFVVEKIIIDKEKFPKGFMERNEAVIVLREILCTNTLRHGWVGGKDDCEKGCAYREKCPFRNLLIIKI